MISAYFHLGGLDIEPILPLSCLNIQGFVFAKPFAAKRSLADHPLMLDLSNGALADDADCALQLR